MVDDDPDSGEFFWNEIRNWNSKPSDYHVVFFDKDKGASRAWISDKRLEKFDGKAKEVGNSRLMKAVKLAQEATNLLIGSVGNGERTFSPGLLRRSVHCICIVCTPRSVPLLSLS